MRWEGKPEGGATDGTRTRDNLNHNQGLYQLSYNHRLWGAALYAVRNAIQAQIMPKIE